MAFFALFVPFLFWNLKLFGAISFYRGATLTKVVVPLCFHQLFGISGLSRCTVENRVSQVDLALLHWAIKDLTASLQQGVLNLELMPRPTKSPQNESSLSVGQRLVSGWSPQNRHNKSKCTSSYATYLPSWTEFTLFFPYINHMQTLQFFIPRHLCTSFYLSYCRLG